jgi:hypothetical protein
MTPTVQTLTIEKAIEVGQKILIPRYILWGLGMLFFIGAERIGYLFWARVLLLIGCWIATVVYSAIKIPKWKIWAFGQVRNVHELKQRAILARIIPADSKTFWLFEFWSAKDKEQWKTISLKFREKDVWEDNSNIAEQTAVYYTKFPPLYLLAIVFLGFFFFHDFVMGIAILLALLTGYVIKIRDRKPQIILSDKGIEAVGIGFYEWCDIQKANVIKDELGAQFIYLTYKYPKGIAKINLNMFDIDAEFLYKLLIFYQKRYDNQH